MSRMAMGEMLLEKRLITEGQLKDALEHQREHGGKLGEILVARGLIDRLTLASALGQQWGKLTEPRRPASAPAAAAAPANLELEATIASQREEIAGLRAKVGELERMVAWLKELTSEMTRANQGAAA